MNIILFCISTHILRQQKQGPKPVLLTTTTALFVLSTANAVLSTMLDLQTFALLVLAEFGDGKCNMLIPEISVVNVIGVTNVVMRWAPDSIISETNPIDVTLKCYSRCVACKYALITLF